MVRSVSHHLHTVYKKLLKHFGPQGWWPTTPPRCESPVYWLRRNLGNLSEEEMFEVCLGAILTQNTSWSNVEKVLTGLKKNHLLTFQRFLHLPRQSMQKHIRSSGYYRQKSLRIKHFMGIVASEYKGRFRQFLGGSTAELREKLLDITGIGPETADSMLLYAAGKPIFVVDAYTRRIAQRLGVIQGNPTYEAVQNLFLEALPRRASIYGETHALLVKLGKEICRKNPNCRVCPVAKLCQYARALKIDKRHKRRI